MYMYVAAWLRFLSLFICFVSGYMVFCLFLLIFYYSTLDKKSKKMEKEQSEPLLTHRRHLLRQSDKANDSWSSRADRSPDDRSSISSDRTEHESFELTYELQVVKNTTPPASTTQRSDTTTTTASRQRLAQHNVDGDLLRLLCADKQVQTNQTVAPPSGAGSPLSVENICWMLAALVVLYLTDLLNVIAYDQRIYRSTYTSFFVLCVNCLIAFKRLLF